MHSLFSFSACDLPFNFKPKASESIENEDQDLRYSFQSERNADFPSLQTNKCRKELKQNEN